MDSLDSQNFRPKLMDSEAIEDIIPHNDNAVAPEGPGAMEHHADRSSKNPWEALSRQELEKMCQIYVAMVEFLVGFRRDEPGTFDPRAIAAQKRKFSAYLGRSAIIFLESLHGFGRSKWEDEPYVAHAAVSILTEALDEVASKKKLPISAAALYAKEHYKQAFGTTHS